MTFLYDNNGACSNSQNAIFDWDSQNNSQNLMYDDWPSVPGNSRMLHCGNLFRQEYSRLTVSSGQPVRTGLTGSRSCCSGCCGSSDVSGCDSSLSPWTGQRAERVLIE